MSNTSTLFDGIDDDKPPPILPGRNLVNLEDNKHSSLSQAEDQSQLNKSNSKITSLNIFNMVKLSETPKNIITLNKDIKWRRLSQKVTDPDNLFNPMITIAQLKEELRLKNDEIQWMNVKMNTLHEK